MMTVVFVTLVAGVLGFVLTPRWGVWGYLVAAGLSFALLVGIKTVGGFNGGSIEESLLLFNGSFAAYLGFNLQVSYRAFALPLLVLGAVAVVRNTRP